MKYQNYVLNLERTTQITRKNGIIKAKGDAAIRPAMQFLYSRFPDTYETMDFFVHAEEYFWLCNGKKVYYPENLELAQSFLRHKNTISTAEAYFDGEESFILASPVGLNCESMASPSIMVTIIDHQQRPDKILNPFVKFIGNRKINAKGGQYYGHSITICYQSDNGNDCEYLRCMLTSDMMEVIGRCETPEEYKEEIERVNEFDYTHGQRLNGNDHAYQFYVIRYLLGFLLYKKALPKRIVDGMPGANRKEFETPYTMQRSHSVVKIPGGHSSAGVLPHYRSWHFRQLMDEKFYQNEHAHKTRGSRIIFVSDTMVNRDVDAKTAHH